MTVQLLEKRQKNFFDRKIEHSILATVKGYTFSAPSWKTTAEIVPNIVPGAFEIIGAFKLRSVRYRRPGGLIDLYQPLFNLFGGRGDR
jgi:hypothetical protein